MTHHRVGKGRPITACQVFASSIQVCAALAFYASVGCSNGTSTGSTVPGPGSAASPPDSTPALAVASNELESMQPGEHAQVVIAGAHAHDANVLHCEVAAEHAAGEHAASEHAAGEHLLHCEHLTGEPVAGEHMHDAHALQCEPVASAHVASEHVAGEQVHELYLHCVHHVAGEQAHEVHLHCQHFVDEHVVGDPVHDAHVLHCEHVTG